MKIEQKVNKEYIPVTLTFETLDELNRFVCILPSYPCCPLPNNTWEELHRITSSYFSKP